MLKPASHAAERFLRDAQVGGDKAQWHPLDDLRRFCQRFLITFSGNVLNWGVHQTFLPGGYNIFHKRCAVIFLLPGADLPAC